MPNNIVEKKKRINVRHSERSLLTDTIPYELPLFFTNANLAIIAFMNRTAPPNHKLHTRLLLWSESNSAATKPLSFEIRRNSGPPRRLDLAHPRSQHLMCIFYEKYEHFICNACSRSDYSLRYPSRIATHYVDPRYSVTEKSKEISADEDPVGFRDQMRWASTYFSYRDYSLSHKFFDSEEFLALERKFMFLMKLDISRCFDSIYTHSIEWSMRGKEFSKTHLPNRTKKTFESEFDLAIRHANWNETHGIVIGPEFSRVFAEVILQSADRAIGQSCLGAEEGLEIRRYVDDYFIFSNSESTLALAKEAVRTSLGALNLHLNEKKTDTIKRPFVSKISAARSRIANSADAFSNVAFPLVGKPGELPDSRKIDQARKNFMASFRSTAIELDVPYDNLSSFAFSVLNRHIGTASECAEKLSPDLTVGHLSRLSWLLSIVRIGQFLFAIDERVTTSVKLAKLYSLVIDIALDLKCARGPIEGQILDGLRSLKPDGSRNDADQISRINHICAVDMLMTGSRKIEISDLRQHLDYDEDPASLMRASSFQLLAMLFIGKKRHRFRKVLASTKQEIERRLSQAGARFLQDAEAAYLLTDYIACPYIDENDKRDIVRSSYRLILGENCSNEKADELVKQSGWITFTDWSGSSDLAAMLARKELTPAYE